MDELKTYGTCQRCMGTGTASTIVDNETIVENPCSACNGSGFFVMGKVDGAVILQEILDEIDSLKKKLKRLLANFNLPED